jgi:hypothetical protein
MDAPAAKDGWERNQPAANFQLDFFGRNPKNGSNNERPD